MSLHPISHDDGETAVRLRAGHFAFAIRRIIAPVLRQITEDRQLRKTAENRRKTHAEIASLPAFLQQDLAFSQDLKHNDI